MLKSLRLKSNPVTQNLYLDQSTFVRLVMVTKTGLKGKTSMIKVYLEVFSLDEHSYD